MYLDTRTTTIKSERTYQKYIIDETSRTLLDARLLIRLISFPEDSIHRCSY